MSGYIMDLRRELGCRPLLQVGASVIVEDGQGRILIPQELRDYAGIGKNATVVGLPDRAEIWDSERYRASEEAYFQEKTMAEIYEELGL